MNQQFDSELNDLADLNYQMLGGKDSKIIDVTDVSEGKPVKKAFKLSRQQMIIVISFLVVATVAGVAVIKKQDSLTESIPANVSAVLAKSAKQPVPMAAEVAQPAQLAGASATPATGVQLPDARAPAQVVASAAAPAHTIVAPVAPVVPAASIVPTVAAPIVPTVAAPVSESDEIKQMKKDIFALRNELSGKTAELEAIKHGPRKLATRAEPKSEIGSGIEVKKVVKQSQPVLVPEKPKEKEKHSLSMKEGGIAVLMDSGLIYSSNGNFVELSIGETFPGYGKLVKVNKDKKTFETPNHIYFLKD